MNELEGSQQLVKLRKEITSALKHSLTLPHDKNAGELERELKKLKKKADSLKALDSPDASQFSALVKEFQEIVDRICAKLEEDKDRVRKILEIQIEALNAGKLSGKEQHELFDKQA